MALRPIHRIKHVIDSASTVAAAAVLNIPLIKTVDAPVIGNTNDVETGSKVNGIYLRVEVASNDEPVVGGIPNVYMAIFKNPGNLLTFPPPNAVGVSAGKKYCIHQEMVMIQNLRGGNSKTLFNGVIAIPRGYIRNGPLDELEAHFLSPQLDIAVCLQAHYKEFR